MHTTPATSRIARAIHKRMHAAATAVTMAQATPTERYALTAALKVLKAMPDAIHAPAIITPRLRAETARLAATRISRRCIRIRVSKVDGSPRSNGRPHSGQTPAARDLRS